MPDYARGKIYKITSGDLTYIGSTCEPTLAKRLANHVVDCKKWKNGKRRFTTSFPLIDTGVYDITLIELCPCGSKDELTARERFHIENTVCVNKNIPGRSRQERRVINKDVIYEQGKAYRELNVDKINEQRREHYPLYYEKNKEAIAERGKVWRDANKDEINARRRELYQARKSLL